MLSQGQFFDAAHFNVHPDKMNFDQFTATADYYHGEYHRDPDSMHTTFENDPRGPHYTTHVGTEQAAKERIRDLGGVGTIVPLRHVGPQSEGVGSDRGTYWEDVVEHARRTGETQRYQNTQEDPGSISAVAPVQNLRTYHDYVDASPHPTERQVAERAGRTAYGYALPQGPEEKVIRGQQFMKLDDKWWRNP